jgi:hypothetical protein
MATSNPWLSFLEDQPDILYGGHLANMGNQPKNFIDYYRSKYGNIYSDYMGKLGQQALSGQAPTLSFSGYLENYNFMNDWRSLSPWSRGSRPSSRAIWNV